MYSSIPPLDFVIVWNIQTRRNTWRSVHKSGWLFYHNTTACQNTNQALVSYSLYQTSILSSSKTNAIGDIVILQKSGTIPIRWPLAHVVATHLGGEKCCVLLRLKLLVWCIYHSLVPLI